MPSKQHRVQSHYNIKRQQRYKTRRWDDFKHVKGTLPQPHKIPQRREERQRYPTIKTHLPLKKKWTKFHHTLVYPQTSDAIQRRSKMLQPMLEKKSCDHESR